MRLLVLMTSTLSGLIKAFCVLNKDHPQKTPIQDKGGPLKALILLPTVDSPQRLRGEFARDVSEFIASALYTRAAFGKENSSGLLLVYKAHRKKLRHVLDRTRLAVCVWEV
ncbi:hypothetical protein WMY93_018523 [Mugilogobius chulae]|uniref:Uncharacterized protein n=1 Tax=Mugilogobius chulae TaxID=88201 RepID=A0AAW0NQL3_9GOBI